MTQKYTKVPCYDKTQPLSLQWYIIKSGNQLIYLGKKERDI